MALEVTQTFFGEQDEIKVKNREALIDVAIVCLYDDEDETDFDFPGYESAYFRVYDGIDQKRVKNFTSQVARSAQTLILNCSESDMSFNRRGKYYYEIGYVRSGGYEMVLRYGDLIVI